MFQEIIAKYNFKQLSEFLERIKSEIINEETKTEYYKPSIHWININTKLKNGLNLKILIHSRKEEIAVVFYFEKYNIKLEQIEFIILNNNEYNFNRLIIHDYFSVTDDIATTFNSRYFFDNDKYVFGGEEIRTLEFKYISLFAGVDNLSNFACTIDSRNIEVIFKESNEVNKEKEIKAFYLRKDKKEYAKSLIRKKIYNA